MDEQEEERGHLIDHLLSTLLRSGSDRTILVLVAVLALFSLAVVRPLYARIETFSGGIGAIDALIVYTPDRAYEMIAAYGQQGRQYYATIALTVDTAFPLLLALTVSLILASVFRRAFARAEVRHRAVLVPVAALAADLLENVGIVTLLLSYPRRLPAVAILASAFSTVKWTAVTAEGVLVVVGLLALLIHKAQQR